MFQKKVDATRFRLTPGVKSAQQVSNLMIDTTMRMTSQIRRLNDLLGAPPVKPKIRRTT
jgi:hypothetical protein